ncbi:MAG TPA: aminopeptidase N [Mycobacteriales bacterium]|jgi:aminopeptidase N|nr:aminopeptidase N [Mycobacteriales bacterium]
MGVPNLTRADARARADLLTVTSYEVELDLTDGGGKPGERTFASRTTIRFTASRPGDSTSVDLIAAGFREATLNGVALDTSGYEPETGIALPDLAADNVLVVDADCLYTNTGEGLHRFVDPVDGEVYLYSQFETADAKRMYTCFDQPDLKGTFALTVTAPAHWEVVSNGRPLDVSETTGGAQQVVFATTPPISPYVTALVAGPYHKVTDTHDGIDLGVYCRASLAEHLDAEDILLVTKQGFDWYHRAFEYRYPFDKYDQLFVPEFNAGAMENVACVTFLDDYVFRSKVTDYSYERRAETILHEMAHMWFGDLVTMRWWDDLWLNESFASFVSVLCQASATRHTSAWTTFANIEKTWAYRQDQLSSTHPIAADIPDIEAVEVNFDGITYAKGASVLKQLAAYVGVEQFLRALQVYFRRHEYGNTTLADLLAALEEESGRDLSRWSAQWLETPGVNTLRASFEVDEDGRYTSVTVEQGPAEPGAGPLRDHRLAVGLYRVDGAKLVRTERIELDVTGARTEVPELAGVLQPDLLLVNDDDLTYGKVRLDERSLATVVARVADIDDPLPRTLCWGAAWDMTRDGEMRARDYVALALAGVTGESEIGVVQSIQGKIRSALMNYAAPDWAPTGWAQLADLSEQELRGAEPGSDLQLAWARTFAAAARTPAQVAVVRGLLDGTGAVPGLSVDTELRWSLLSALVALGAAGDDEIEAELDRDPTASGQRRAATARALRPTEAAKAEAWRLATEDDDLPNAINEAIIGGFHHPEQDALTEPYLARYFEVIPDVWERRTSEIAQNVVVGLFPDAASPSVVDAAEAFLADPAVPPALRRLVAEGRDDTVRALKGRARDAT